MVKKAGRCENDSELLKTLISLDGPKVIMKNSPSKGYLQEPHCDLSQTRQ